MEMLGGDSIQMNAVRRIIEKSKTGMDNMTGGILYLPFGEQMRASLFKIR